MVTVSHDMSRSIGASMIIMHRHLTPVAYGGCRDSSVAGRVVMEVQVTSHGIETASQDLGKLSRSPK